MKKNIFSLFTLLSLFFIFGVSIVAAEEPATEQVIFDLTKFEKQEIEVISPSGEEGVMGIEPISFIPEKPENDGSYSTRASSTYTKSAGTYAWRSYYDSGSLASEFYATVVIPSSGYSRIDQVYNGRVIRSIGGSVSSERLTLIRKYQTATAPAQASFGFTTTWYAGWGSSSPLLNLSVTGKNVTVTAKGFVW